MKKCARYYINHPQWSHQRFETENQAMNFMEERFIKACAIRREEYLVITLEDLLKKGAIEDLIDCIREESDEFGSPDDYLSDITDEIKEKLIANIISFLNSQGIASYFEACKHSYVVGEPEAYKYESVIPRKIGMK